MPDRLPCPLCRRRLPQTPAACEPCRARLARQLAAIPPLLTTLLAEASMAAADIVSIQTALDADPVNHMLPAGPVPAAPTGPIARHGGYAHSPAPPGLDVHLADPTPPSVRRLADWALSRSAPIQWLTRHLDQICDRGEGLRDFAANLAAAVRDLQNATGDRRQLIGHCPTDDCPGDIYADPHEQTAACAVCGTTWPRRHWLWLADTLRAA